MIHYQLRCRAEHQFDGWFRDSAGFEAQARGGFVACPECGDTVVNRALMAPSIGRKRVTVEAKPETKPEAAPAPEAGELLAAGMPDRMRAVLQRIRAEVERQSDYVGPSFADEARRIHRGETERRSIYGESTEAEAEALAEEGVAFARIPWVRPADG